MSAEVVTLGCRLNLAESETIARLAGSGAIVINSCAVTGEAVRQARQTARRLRRERPGARIVMTGCAAQIDPAAFAAMPEIDLVLGNREKLAAAAYRPAAPRVAVADAMAPGAAPEPVAGGRTRVFVQVQTGCDHRCTFCIIPYGRGPSRSVPAGAVVARIAALVEAGAREVVLTGVDVTSYGADLPGAPTLGGLVRRILARVPALPRLRLSSIDCIEIDPELEALIASEARLMPHLHLSLQSGDDMILKRMRRRHGRAQAIALVERLKARRPEIAIGADLIAGFPTETEAMFENSLRIVEQCDVVMGHVFPFSPRAGTPAARMPQLPPGTARARAARLRTACEERRGKWLATLVGTRQRVLVERGGVGHAENFAPVRIAAPAGSIVAARITDAANDMTSGVTA